MKLIDADKLKMSFKPYFDGKKTIGQIIDEQPTVEAQPTDDECDNDCEHCEWVTCPKMEREEAQTSDAVSRSEALKRIDAERQHLLDIKMDGAEHILVHHARRIIEDLPSVNPKTVTEFADKCKECGKIQKELFEDAMSRSEAIKKFNEVAYPIVHGRNSHDKGMTLTEIEQVMNELSAVQIQMKRGFWKEKHYANYPTWHECSICGFEAYEENGDEHLSNFCPNCGAALKEGENS